MDRSRNCRVTRMTWPLLVGLFVLTTGAGGALAQTPDDFVGSETCLECHDGMAEHYGNSVHGRLANYQYPGMAEGCEACHGPGALHAETNEIDDILVPGRNGGSDNCLACHKTGHTVDWEWSAHAAADVGCVSCHKIHGDASIRPLLAESQDTLCFSCHQDVQAAFHLPSHHPVQEGFLSCSSCHNVHGDQFQNVGDGEPVREVCLSCHNEHAGPFIFEHSPVMEDCLICHTPHGAVANNLLQQNEPFLCLQCHQPHFHSILAGSEGDYSPPTSYTDGSGNVQDGIAVRIPRIANLSGTSTHDSMKQTMLTKCTQCHQSVHGTDLPSQSIPGQGRALNR